MTIVSSIDPRTGRDLGPVAEESTAEEVDRLCRLASAAAPALEGRGRAFRAVLLRAMADALEAGRDDIVATADRETAIGESRLHGELTRTTYQMRLFAEVIEEGSYLEAAIDHAGDTPMGPRPDLRRMLVPIGPVAVFGASNFPLAFSVPGGDTVSALAAGCPVVLKAHEAHPATSVLCFDLLGRAAAAVGAPEGTLGLLHGRDAGARLVMHPAIRAVSFTGSLSGGRALLALINSRPDPVPFYGELSSLNPVVVTPHAAEDRAEEIAEGLVGSFTIAAGQLCTKPGLVLVPSGDAGERLIAEVARLMDTVGPQVLLNERIYQSYDETLDRWRRDSQIQAIAGPSAPQSEGYWVSPFLLRVPAGDLSGDVVEECFGPVTVVVIYDDEEQLSGVLRRLPSALTASLHGGSAEDEMVARLTPKLRAKAGRLIYDGFPTGVSVTWAQHHGGPWPATNSLHTSVGTSAVRRFLRPVAWQNAPAAVLPQEVRDDGPPIPRRIDGRFMVPAETA